MSLVFKRGAYVLKQFLDIVRPADDNIFDDETKECNLSSKELAMIRSILDPITDKAEPASIKINDQLKIELIELAANAMRTKYTFKPRDFGDKLTNNLADLFTYSLRIISPPTSEDPDRYRHNGDDDFLEANMKGYTEKYVNILLERRKEILGPIGLYNYQEDIKEESTVVNKDMPCSSTEPGRSADLSSPMMERDVGLLLLCIYILSRDGDGLISFIETGCLFMKSADFLHRFYDLILFTSFLKEDSLKDLIMGDIPDTDLEVTNNWDSALLNKFQNLVFLKAKKLIMPMRACFEKFNKALNIELNRNNTIRMTIKNISLPEHIGIYIPYLRKKTGPLIPLYEIRFVNINFFQENLSGLSHVMEYYKIRRIKFESCTFNKDVFDLSSIDANLLKKIKELRFINCKIKDIASLKPFTNLKVLDIYKHSFNTIPPSIFEATGLMELGIRDGSLNGISPDLKKLTKLKGLYLSGNQLASIPEVVISMTHLTKLIVNDNKITSIKRLDKLVNLKHLVLDSNNLEPMPDNTYFPFPKLTYLSMRSCFLNTTQTGSESAQSTPNWFSLFRMQKELSLPNLEWLDLSDNNLCDLPGEIFLMKKLKTLILNNNDITQASVEDAINYAETNKREGSLLPSIKRLVLSHCTQLKDIPKNIFKLSNLKELLVMSCSLSEIPNDITLLTKLVTVDLSKNNLKGFPGSITQLLNLENVDLSHNTQMKKLTIPNGVLSKKLKSLHVSDCGLTDLPNELFNFVELRELDISHNSLTQFKLPNEKTKCFKRLERLDMSYNPSKCLSGDICLLTSLKVLRINNSRISQLPENFSNLENLNELNMSHNLFNELPASIPSLRLLESLDISYNTIDIYYLFEQLSELISLRDLNVAQNSKSNHLKIFRCFRKKLFSLENIDVICDCCK